MNIKLLNDLGLSSSEFHPKINLFLENKEFFRLYSEGFNPTGVGRRINIFQARINSETLEFYLIDSTIVFRKILLSNSIRTQYEHKYLELNEGEIIALKKLWCNLMAEVEKMEELYRERRRLEF